MINLLGPPDASLAHPNAFRANGIVEVTRDFNLRPEIRPRLLRRMPL